MHKRFLTRDEFLGLIGRFTPAIDGKGTAFIEGCFNHCSFWYYTEMTDLDSDVRRGDAGLGFCIGCCRLYHVTPQRDNGFLHADGKEYGPYCYTCALSAMNLLDDKRK